MSKVAKARRSSLPAARDVDVEAFRTEAALGDEAIGDGDEVAAGGGRDVEAKLGDAPIGEDVEFTGDMQEPCGMPEKR